MLTLLLPIGKIINDHNDVNVTSDNCGITLHKNNPPLEKGIDINNKV